MKTLVLSLFLSFLFLGRAQTIDLNTETASVSFNYVDEDTRGTLEGVKASIQIDPSNLKASKVVGSVAVNTLSTGNKTRDNHLKSPDFFDAEKYPEMHFEATEIFKDGDQMKAKGKLTIKETTKDVTFLVVEKDGVLQFKTTLYSADFGVSVKKDRSTSKLYVIVKVPLS